jgi:hypothetical protein
MRRMGDVADAERHAISLTEPSSWRNSVKQGQQRQAHLIQTQVP